MWWNWWLSRRGRRTGKFSWASWQSLHSLRHGDRCREDQADDKQHQWHQHRDQSEWTEAWDSHKLQVPWLSYNSWGFKAWDTLQGSTDNSCIDKAETNLEWQEYFSQLQGTIDALPCNRHITNEEICAKIQQAIGADKDLRTIVKRCKQKWYEHVSCSSGLTKTILQGTVKRRRRQGRQKKRWEYQGMDRPGVRQVPKGSGEQRKMERLVVKSAGVPQETPPLN